jgi:hypothetical protein
MTKRKRKKDNRSPKSKKGRQHDDQEKKDKRTTEALNQRRTDNTMTKRKRTKGQQKP